MIIPVTAKFVKVERSLNSLFSKFVVVPHRPQRRLHPQARAAQDGEGQISAEVGGAGHGGLDQNDYITFGGGLAEAGGDFMEVTFLIALFKFGPGGVT